VMMPSMTPKLMGEGKVPKCQLADKEGGCANAIAANSRRSGSANLLQINTIFPPPVPVVLDVLFH
jgi:hypothetical protein